MPPTTPAAESRVAAAGFVAAGLAGVALSWTFASADGGILGSGWSLLVRLAVWAAVWALAVACALRLPRRVALAGVFVVAVALRLAALAGPPTLSDDLYRYAWDGRVQAEGIDPYRYRPTSSQLRSLREPWLWPDAAGCADLGRQPNCSRINRATVRTIYPPLAQAWFAAVYRVSGIDAEHKAWQVAGLVGDLALIGLLPLALRAWKRDERWTALYALSPLPVVEVVNNGHVDGLAALFLVAAFLALGRRRPGWAGALIGAATLVKLYPALLLLALLGGRQRRRLPDLVRATVAAGAVVVAGYLPHVLTVGFKVLGYLPGYLREENYDSGGRYLLASLLHLPVVPAAVVAGAGMALVVAWVVRARPSPPRAAAALVGALLLATTPVQPWYAVTLLAVATVSAAPAWALVAAAAYPLFFAVILDAPHTVAIGRLSYGLALAGVVAAAMVARRRGKVDECPTS
ncbi:MAG TPA: glycosyltransferase family 87 protein [Acidimicrobiales bacterium]